MPLSILRIEFFRQISAWLPNSRAQEIGLPNQTGKRNHAQPDQSMIDLPTSRHVHPYHADLHSSWRAHTRAPPRSDTQGKGERRRACAFDSLVFSPPPPSFHLAQLEASKELAIIACWTRRVERNGGKNRDRLQELMCFVKPSVNTIKSKRLRKSVTW